MGVPARSRMGVPWNLTVTRMRKLRTTEQLERIELWLQNRKSTRKIVREAKSGHDLLKMPTVMTEKNLESARNYEWFLLGPDLRCPREGDVYIAVREIAAGSMEYYRAPFTGGEEVVIPMGTRIRIATDSVHESPTIIFALPVNYEELERYFVSSDSLRDPKYAGYGLVINIHEFKDGLKLESKDRLRLARQILRELKFRPKLKVFIAAVAGLVILGCIALFI